MLISLSKELKERNLNNARLRNVILRKLRFNRGLDSHWEVKRRIRNFIWGLYRAKKYPELLAGNQKEETND